MKLSRLSLIVFVLFCSGRESFGSILVGPIINPSTGNAYYLLSQNDWTGSEAEAVSLGGHLATINDPAEDAWVSSTFSNFGGIARALWIGLNDAAVENTFVWSSGEPVGYLNFAGGEPNDNLGMEDWVHIFPSIDPRFPRWNDAPDAPNNFGFVFNGVAEVPAPEPAMLIVWGGLILVSAKRFAGLRKASGA
jgi:hypothetical protein